MSDLQLGVTLPQFTDDAQRFIEGARRAEDAGLDSVWVFDHLWPLSGNKDRPVLEAWTSLAWVAARTEKVAIGTLVTRSSLRNVAVLIHMARTVAAIATGRLIIGIGSGDQLSRAENEAFGIPYWSGAERVEQFEATVVKLRAAVADEGVRIWVAGRSDDALDLAARCGDAWNGWGGTATTYARDAATVLEYAGDRGVELTWGGVLKDQPVEETAARLSGFAGAGARHLVCTFSNAWRPGLYETLAQDVRPLIDVGAP
jgi:alkanesulfonate monooxygenase SsuD/methylene tetrahydromethanopterin reductase-like flavin-dependent oxidoreductase (luciferase family)